MHSKQLKVFFVKPNNFLNVFYTKVEFSDGIDNSLIVQHRLETKIKRRTLNPRWNETFYFEGTLSVFLLDSGVPGEREREKPLSLSLPLLPPPSPFLLRPFLSPHN